MRQARALLAACESEPIHAPGAIQGWGALLIAGGEDLVVRHASANLAEFLHSDGAAAIGRTLAALIGPQALAEVLQGASLNDAGGITVTVPAQAAGLPGLAMTGHRVDGLIYVEIEPDPAPWHGGRDALPSGRAIVAALRAAPDFDTLFAVATAQLKLVTGFDRVMVYRFDIDCHGEVIAEDRAPDQEPLLGLHYPAVDIPPQAWRIFSRVIVRVIGNAHAAPVPLLGGGPDGVGADLSLLALRSPSACHMEYLRNMGSHATTTVALTVEGTLWGLLACHHRTAAQLSPERRSLCELIGQVMSLMIVALRDAGIRQAAAASRARLIDMAARLAARQDDPPALAAALAAEGPELLGLCGATGVIVRLAGITSSCGSAPDGEVGARLLDALLKLAPEDGGTFAFDALGSALVHQGLGDQLLAAYDVAGALVLPLTHQAGDAVVWLRQEQARAVHWAGNPEQPMDFDVALNRLVPRRSFAIWQEDVRGRCQPWSEPDHAAARGLRAKIDKLLVGYAESMRVARVAAERATKAKSDFLATMSHEIRSPMSGLLGVLDLLRATNLDPDQSRMAGMIHNSASMLLAVLNDILDFSKIEAGALAISLAPVRLRALVGDLVHPLTVAPAGKQVVVRHAIDPAVPDRVRTDPLRLRQILGNLMGNAVKFTARGEVELRVDIGGSPAAPLLQFHVRDTGIGIAPDVVGRLFAPFMQADGSTTRNFGGTGLGLCISRQLARLLEGDLAVVSTPGVGSVFTLTLPLLACDEEEAAPPACDVAPSPPGADGRRVLVVDDDATIRWLSQRQLEKLGFVVTVAADGESALELLRAGGHDLLLTDCHMPRMDGVALTRALRASADPDLLALPIIGLTADVTEQQRDLCQESGMSDLAIKPLTMDRLAALLHRHLPAHTPGQPPAPAPAATALRYLALDDEIYLSIFERGDAEGAAWLRGYLDVARVDVASLRELVAAPPDVMRREDVRLLAHRLAGASFSVGAMLLGAAARALEGAAGQAAPGEVQILYDAVAAELGGAEDAIARFLDVPGLALAAH